MLGAIAWRMRPSLFWRNFGGKDGGHFKSTEPAFPEGSRRRVFVLPYVLTRGFRGPVGAGLMEAI